MTAIQKEADEIISLMRQSKMDRIRAYLEDQFKLIKKGDKSAALFIQELRYMFRETSNNAPLP